MGYRLNRSYVLKFEGEMEGAEVRLRSTNIATVLKMRETTDTNELVGMLVEHVVDWNLDDEKGEPLPVTVDAVLNGLEEVVVAEILLEWFKAATGVTAPLVKPSIDTELERSMKMDILPGNPSN